MLKITLLAVLGSIASVISAAAQQPTRIDPAVVDNVIKNTFKGATPDWLARIQPDEAQRVCSQYRGAPPLAQSKELMEKAQASITYPSDGNVIGDWKKGEQLAQRGTGGQFSDKADTPKGANCYACHQLAPTELSFGTLGPSLLEYGKNRKFKPEEAKAAYAKIFNPQIVQACSNMPRFGHNKYLTEQEMQDLTAYLFDPASPVNR